MNSCFRMLFLGSFFLLTSSYVPRCGSSHRIYKYLKEKETEVEQLDNIITSTESVSNFNIKESIDEQNNRLPFPKIENKDVAIISGILGSFLFFFQHTQPVSGAALLDTMSRESMPLQRALCNGRPTIVDFYADWCENCKAMAPTMRRMETKYQDKVNFVVIDGANPENGELVGKFRVDGIPHLSFITTKGEVQTSLIGAVPETIVDEEIYSLYKGKELPYFGFDAFEGQSHFPFPSNSMCASSE